MRSGDALTLVVLAALWGSSFLFIRVAVPSFGPVALVTARVLLGAAVLWMYAIWSRRPLEIRRYAGRLIILAALNAALPYVLISAAELHITASFAAVLTATVPLFAALFGILWLGERLSSSRAIGLVLGVAGVSVMVGWSPVPITFTSVVSIGAMLASSASYAAAGVYARRELHGAPTHTLAFGQQLGALVWLAVPAAASVPDSIPPASAIGAVFALGVLSTAVAYLLYFRLLDSIGPTRTSTVTFLLPVFGLLLGVAFLDEVVTKGMVAGFAIVIASVILVTGFRIGAAVRQPATQGR